MLSPEVKIGLLLGVLNQRSYCDFTESKDREQIETIRDTLSQYDAWFLANMPTRSTGMDDALVAGRAMLSESVRLLASGDFRSLATLESLKEIFKIALASR